MKITRLSASNKLNDFFKKRLMRLIDAKNGKK